MGQAAGRVLLQTILGDDRIVFRPAVLNIAVGEFFLLVEISGVAALDVVLQFCKALLQMWLHTGNVNAG